jgi:hypothetical protein
MDFIKIIHTGGKKMKFNKIMVLVLLLFASQAYAGLKVSLLGGANFQKHVNSSEDAKTGYLIGALGEVPTGYFGFETGLLYNQFFKTNNTSYNFKFYQIPLLLRYHFLRFFSLGAGAYIANTEVSFSKNDLGLQGSARFTFPLGIITSFMMELRYLDSFNYNSSSANLRLRDTQFFAGLKFGF